MHRVSNAKGIAQLTSQLVLAHKAGAPVPKVLGAKPGGADRGGEPRKHGFLTPGCRKPPVPGAEGASIKQEAARRAGREDQNRRAVCSPLSVDALFLKKIFIF